METANAVLSLFLPVLVSIVKQSGYDDRVNKLIALAVYIAWAVVVTLAVGGEFNFVTFLNNFVTTLVTGTIAYQMIWKSFGFDDALTDATSFRKPIEEDVEVAEA